jgi:hypothetical protein
MYAYNLGFLTDIDPMQNKRLKYTLYGSKVSSHLPFCGYDSIIKYMDNFKQGTIHFSFSNAFTKEMLLQ